ncbi:MAG: hypothetical protein LUF27_16455 [Lachnospiraceae bacterium]|nr:hypothetical protein [Lachnospiraceae bacterium]
MFEKRKEKKEQASLYTAKLYEPKKYKPTLYTAQLYKPKLYEAQPYRPALYTAKTYVPEVFTTLGLSEMKDSKVSQIEREFGRKTSILNKTDLSFLTVATALLVVKGVAFGSVAGKAGYGTGFDRNTRMAHNDPKIERRARERKDRFRDQRMESHPAGIWTELIYRTPPYDITAGSPKLGRNMEGGYHRIHTLGHDPILGWLFGTLNILTDTITFEDFASYRVQRKPRMKITAERVLLPGMIREAYTMVRADWMCLPAAVFAQAVHLESDRHTKAGLPIPVLEVFSPEIAGKLYKEQYDELCLTRDLKTVATSAQIAIFFNMVVGLLHGLCYQQGRDGSRQLYEARTRKILAISNTVASSSNIIYSVVTKNPRNLDIGGLIVTVTRLFSDARFVAKLKEEYIRTGSGMYLPY